MQRIEKKMKQNGFQKLQEKESCVYFEKIIERQNDYYQLCVCFDKRNEKMKFKSVFVIDEKMDLQVLEPTKAEKIFQHFKIS